ncbi:DoxX family protein [Ornithinibacillus salinisoli]|uniref:DoxX family protein n=1 Tax=Ornithinibacillus salinisoli TaxID=1848459 RepID=A0ABW4W2B2_9BACI
MSNWICYAVGYVFITSGIMKLMNPTFKETFYNLNLPFPEITLFLIAILEIASGALIVGGVYVKQAAITLLIIISGAIYLTKLPTLFNEGIVAFAFQARLDIVMVILLILIWKHIRGKYIS